MTPLLRALGAFVTLVLSLLDRPHDEVLDGACLARALKAAGYTPTYRPCTFPRPAPKQTRRRRKRRAALKQVLPLPTPIKAHP